MAAIPESVRPTSRDPGEKPQRTLERAPECWERDPGEIEDVDQQARRRGRRRQRGGGGGGSGGSGSTMFPLPGHADGGAHRRFELGIAEM